MSKHRPTAQVPPMTPLIALTDHLRRIIEQLNDPLIEVERYDIHECLESIDITVSFLRLGISDLGISINHSGKSS